MGETEEDRLSLALELAGLGVDSIPVNVLTPIKGTPLEGRRRLKEEEILRTVAVFRLLNPKAEIRLAAGRNLMKDCGREAFCSGANGQSLVICSLHPATGWKTTEKCFYSLDFH